MDDFHYKPLYIDINNNNIVSTFNLKKYRNKIDDYNYIFDEENNYSKLYAILEIKISKKNLKDSF